MKEFDEREHPRDKDGKFTDDGNGKSNKEKLAEVESIYNTEPQNIPVRENRIGLSSHEYAVLRKEVMRKNSKQKGKVKPINFAYTSNNFYVYSTTGDDNFEPLEQLDIEENRDTINYYENLIRGKT